MLIHGNLKQIPKNNIKDPIKEHLKLKTTVT